MFDAHGRLANYRILGTVLIIVADVFKCEKCRHTWIGFNVTSCHKCTPSALPVLPKSRGHDKVAICRSNRCGHYNADRDACQLLIDKGRAGRVMYLLTHPATKCVADEPLF